jgi:SAM-dependent methyltransferase
VRGASEWSATERMLSRADHLTFRGNLRDTRYGWLRLTPAYSVALVGELLPAKPAAHERVLDPFCGTGTTALVCAERGIRADTTDINPFLLWLAKTKTSAYGRAEIEGFLELGRQCSRALARAPAQSRAWVPALYQIEKWWDPAELSQLARLHRKLAASEALPRRVLDLARVAFCQALIASSNVSFGHQSMSFAKGRAKLALAANSGRVLGAWQRAVETIAAAAATPVVRAPRVLACDARALEARFAAETFTSVITSPPYPNRMSYVRELRPYMYWLGYLTDGRAAGELDWSAIGGTWGTATSRVARWEASEGERVPVRRFSRLVAEISRRSEVLGRYVHKYFCDMTRHSEALLPLVARGGSIHYIVGNSKFYDVLLPVESIFAELFTAVGFTEASVKRIRKRSSKRELYEYVVSAKRA